MPRSTWEGSTAPAAHAAPVETAMPGQVEGHEQALRLGVLEGDVRGVRNPRSVAVAERPGERAGAWLRGSRAASRGGAASVARLRAGDLGRASDARRSRATFSVPARRLRSCEPPWTRAFMPGAALHVERSDTLGPVELVGRQGQGIDAEGVDVDGDLARRPGRRRSGRGAPGGARSPTTSATGWITPVSLLASINATRAVVSSTRAARSARSTTPSAPARTRLDRETGFGECPGRDAGPRDARWPRPRPCDAPGRARCHEAARGPCCRPRCRCP